MKKNRQSTINRTTTETDISITLNLDGNGEYKVDTTVPFLDHMLSLFAKHSGFDLTLTAKGDTEIDYHHIVEDIGICLGSALKQALGDKVGIRRFGEATIPMDEALIRVALDISGRPLLVSNLSLGAPKVGEFDTELIKEFFGGFTSQSAVTLHINQLAGANTHHIIEAVFKAFAKATAAAVAIIPNSTTVPSTKGQID